MGGVLVWHLPVSPRLSVRVYDAIGAEQRRHVCKCAIGLQVFHALGGLIIRDPHSG